MKERWSHIYKGAYVSISKEDWAAHKWDGYGQSIVGTWLYVRNFLGKHNKLYCET